MVSPAAIGPDQLNGLLVDPAGAVIVIAGSMIALFLVTDVVTFDPPALTFCAQKRPIMRYLPSCGAVKRTTAHSPFDPGCIVSPIGESRNGFVIVIAEDCRTSGRLSLSVGLAPRRQPRKFWPLQLLVTQLLTQLLKGTEKKGVRVDFFKLSRD